MNSTALARLRRFLCVSLKKLRVTHSTHWRDVPSVTGVCDRERERQRGRGRVQEAIADVTRSKKKQKTGPCDNRKKNLMQCSGTCAARIFKHDWRLGVPQLAEPRWIEKPRFFHGPITRYKNTRKGSSLPTVIFDVVVSPFLPPESFMNVSGVSKTNNWESATHIDYVTFTVDNFVV